MAKQDGASPKGTEDEAIGRPGPWGENRYEKKGQPLDQSVRTPPGSSPTEDKPVSTPVTRRDYATSTGGKGPTESKGPTGSKGDSTSNDNQAPGGDAG